MHFDIDVTDFLLFFFLTCSFLWWQDNPSSSLSEETPLPQGQGEAGKEEEDEEEEEEEEQYEVEAAPSLEATSLDDMAKLITVEEVSAASCICWYRWIIWLNNIDFF